jgi:hypothetical protein
MTALVGNSMHYFIRASSRHTLSEDYVVAVVFEIVLAIHDIRSERHLNC